jgi:enoyl-CoA hydratase/carnithine racemase
MESAVLFEKRGAVALVTLNRPDKRNALSIEACRLLRDAYARFDSDDNLKVMVITGAGEKAFCAGYDISEKTSGRVATERDFVPRLATEIFVSKPVIAAVNGAALAAGMALVEACDLVVASENAWFSLPEVKLGIGVVPFVQSLWTLPQHVLMELLLTGEPLSAKRAYEVGFVNRLFAAEDLIPGAIALGEIISANAPLAVTAGKAMVYKGIEAMGNPQALEVARKLFLVVDGSEDALEGFRARAEHRSPVWKGV